MEGSCCTAALEAAPARDAPRPLCPRVKRGAASGVRGAGCWWKSLRHSPTAVAARPERPWGGRGEEGHGQGAEGTCCFFLVERGIYCCLGVRAGRCRLILDRDEIL